MTSDEVKGKATADPRAFSGPRVVGTPAERAVQIFGAYPEHEDELRRYVEDLPTSFEPETGRWLEESLGLLSFHFPDVVEYLMACADYLGCELMPMYAGANAAALRGGVTVPGFVDPEGCSIAGGVHSGVGAWLVKNRDSNPSVLKRQIISEHTDPSWDGRSVACVSNVGGLMAVSSGINTAGFASITTAVTLEAAPPGIFRAHLQDGLLARCTTVDQALDIIADVPHIGGTITLADATGVVATVDLAPTGPVVIRENGDGVAKTNHFTGEESEQEQVGKPENRYNSECRLGTMNELIARADADSMAWPEFRDWLRSQVADHEGDGAVCKHNTKSITVNTSVFSTNPPSMLASQGPGCEGDWVEWRPS